MLSLPSFIYLLFFCRGYDKGNINKPALVRFFSFVSRIELKRGPMIKILSRRAGSIRIVYTYRHLSILINPQALLLIKACESPGNVQVGRLVISHLDTHMCGK